MKVSRMARVGVAALTFVCVGQVVFADAAKEQKVTLTQREGNGPYGNSAFSFRQATQDLKKHKNYVDVLLNNCGLLHINMYTSEKNRICDLGAMDLAKAPKEAPANATWMEDCIKPQAGHVYLEEIADDDQKMTVLFRVDQVGQNGVDLTWVTVKPMQGQPLPANHGAAGTHGSCGKNGHPEK